MTHSLDRAVRIARRCSMVQLAFGRPTKPCSVARCWTPLGALRYITAISCSLIGVGLGATALAEADETHSLALGVKSFTSWGLVSNDTKESLRGFMGRVELATDTPLSEADARLLATVRGDLVIESPGLTPAAAQILCSGRSSLNLLGLSEVSAEMAETLGTCAGPLCLPDCHDLSPKTLRSLLAGNRYGLRIGGLRITAEHARIIEDFGGVIELGPVSLLDEEPAKSLTRYKGRLELRINELSPAAAMALGRGDERLRICLVPGPVRLTQAMAAAMSSHSGRLTLGHVSFEPDRKTVLTELSRHEGEVEMFLGPGEALTLAEAIALSERLTPEGQTRGSSDPAIAITTKKSFGDLTLLSQAEFSAEVAEALASRVGGKLSVKLSGGLSESLARGLAKHNGPLKVRFWSRRAGTQPSAEAIASLCRHSGSLELTGEWIRPDTITSVVSHTGGLTVAIPATSSGLFTLARDQSTSSSSTDTYEWMSGEVLERLAAYSGPLHVQGFAPDEVVEILARHRADLAMDRMPRGKIGLQALLGRDGALYFTADATVDSVEAATLFASENNKTAVCTSSHLIGADAEDIATILIKRKGPISFPYLRYINADALRILATKEDVRLLPLDRIFILSTHGFDVAPKQVVSERFLESNSRNQPPEVLPEWHSWDRLHKAAQYAEPGVGADSR